MSHITTGDPKQPLRMYLAAPDSGGPWPGVVVLHDALGQTADSHRYVDWFAEAGYIAISPDLYSRGGMAKCIRAVTRDLITRKGTTFADIAAARQILASRPDCTAKIGVIGFCMGGGFALLVAARHEFEAASVNYGAVPDDIDELLKGACPVVGSFGAKDRTQKHPAARLERALAASGVDHDVKEYAEAGHSFMNNHRGAFAWAMARVGFAYRQQPTDDARRRILDFFGKHLGHHGE